MFGWEFPPHITGGLGTACYGLTRGLAEHGAEIIFVVPKAYGNEDERFVRIVNASEVEMPCGEAVDNELWEQVSFMQINSNMLPYCTPEEFHMVAENFATPVENPATTEPHSDINPKQLSAHNPTEIPNGKESGNVWRRRYEFSGSYGNNLHEEVRRYGVIAKHVATRLNGQFDVIHAHDWLTYYAGVAAKSVSGKPLAVHIHATEFDRSGKQINETIYAIERFGMERADVVIAVSNLTRNIVIGHYGIPEHKVITVHNAVQFAARTEVQYPRVLKEKVVTFLGRVTSQKGPEYFVEAAAKVLKRRRDIRFVMAGDGDMLHRIIRRVAALGISDRFHFTGFLRGAEVERMFALSDVYVMPSVSEPFGISPLEAMRAGVPVIISRQSGVSEIVNHAVKVDYWDVDGLADAIYGLTTYDTLAKTLSINGRAEVSTIKWKHAAAKILDIYERLTGC